MDAFRNDAPQLTPEQEDRVRSELSPDEKLVWIGQPRPDLAARGSCFVVGMGVFFILFSLFWIGIALYVGGMFAQQAAWGAADILPMLFPVCGVPFVVIGILMLNAPGWMRARGRRTIYALTDRRAILWEPNWVTSITTRSYTRDGLGRMARQENADGSGDLIFEEFVTYGTNSDGARTSHLNRRGFLGIDRVREVEQMVRETLLR
jgi:hypothetical protein